MCKKRRKTSIALALVICLGLTQVCSAEDKYIVEESSTVASTISEQRMEASLKYIEEYYSQYPNEVKYYPNMLESQINKIQAKVDSLTGNEVGTAKVKAIYDWVTNNVDYSIYGMCPEVNPYDVFCKGVSNCYGQALLTSTMLRMAGFQAVVAAGWNLNLSKYTLGELDKRYKDMLSGTLAESGSGSHAWVMVKVDGKWYLIDTVNGIFMRDKNPTYLVEEINGVFEDYSGRYVSREGLYHKGDDYYYHDGNKVVTENSSIERHVDGFNLGRIEIKNGKVDRSATNSLGKRIHPNGYAETMSVEIKNGETYIGGVKVDVPPSEIRYEYGSVVMKVGTIFTFEMPKPTDSDRQVEVEVLKLDFEDGEQYSNYPITVEGNKVTLNKQGYVLINLYEKSTSGGYNSLGSIEVMITNDYKITFDTNGGNEVYESRIIQSGTSIGHLPTPTREGYSFDHWVDENGNKVNPYEVVYPKGNITLKAIWTKQKLEPEKEPEQEPEQKAFDGTVLLSATKFTYSGKVRKPTISVKTAEGDVLSASNYKVTYSKGLKNVGSYSATITFTKKYKGSVEKKFEIVPKGTKLISLKATSRGFKAKWKKQATQTSGYQLRYGLSEDMSDSKTITITKNKTTSKLVGKLETGKDYFVQLRTYKKVSGKTFYSSWSSAKSVKTK